MQRLIYFPSTDKPDEYFNTVLPINSTEQWNQGKFHQLKESNVVWYGGVESDEPTQEVRLPSIEVIPQLTQNIQPADKENLRLLCHLLVDWLPTQTLYEIVKVAAAYLSQKASTTELYGQISSSTEKSSAVNQNRLFGLAEQFEQDRYSLSPEEEDALLDEEFLEWLENN